MAGASDPGCRPRFAITIPTHCPSTPGYSPTCRLLVQVCVCPFIVFYMMSMCVYVCVCVCVCERERERELAVLFIHDVVMVIKLRSQSMVWKTETAPRGG